MSLPDDLAREILSKLANSIKSAARLSCVCKSWREWITHPDFLKSHPVMVIYQPGGDPYFTFHRRGSEYHILTHHPDIVYPLNLPQGLRLKVIGECNGILFLLNLDNPFIFLLFNPITSECRKLPPPGLQCSSSNSHRLNYGFGFDKREKDYKIIRFWKVEETRTAVAEVYKLSTNCWTNVDVDLGFIPGTSYCSIGSLYVNGSCYWLRGIYSSTKSMSIVSFDLQTETFGHIKDMTPLMPSYDGEYMTTPDLGVVDDSLAICVMKFYHVVTEVWVMSECRNTEPNWTKKFTIKSCNTGTSCSWVHDVNLFQYTRDGQLLTYLTDEEGEEAQKARTRMFKANDRYCRSTVFKPSLVSLRSG